MAGFDSLIQGVINLLTGNAAQAQQQNVAGGQTANQVQAQPPAAIQQPQNPVATQQPQQGMGISPLAESLLAGYFSAIGSPKLAGWGGALSRGGLSALGTYAQAQNQAIEQQRLQAQMQQEQVRTQLEQQKLDLAKTEAGPSGRYLEAQASAEEAKANAAQAPQRYYRIGPDGQLDGTAIDVPANQLPPTDHPYISQDAFEKYFGKDEKLTPREKAKETALGRAEAEKELPVDTAKGQHYLNPQTLEPLSGISRAEARKQGALVVNDKDKASIDKLQNATHAIDTLKEASKDVLTKKEDLGITGKLGAAMSVKAMRLQDPQSTAAYDSAQAQITGLASELLNTGRMNLTEFKNIMANMPTDGDTVESATTKLDSAREAIQAKLKNILPKPATSSSSTIDVPGIGPIKRIN